MIHSAQLAQPVNSSRFISQDIWTNVIHPEALRQCDDLDGVRIITFRAVINTDQYIFLYSLKMVSSTTPADAVSGQRRWPAVLNRTPQLVCPWAR